MLYNLFLTYGSLLYIVILALIYFRKEKVKSFRAQFFAELIISFTLFSISDISNILIHIYIENEVILRVSYISHWFIYMVSIFIFITYLTNIVYKAKTFTELKNASKHGGFLLIYTLILWIVYFCLPYSHPFDIEKMNFLNYETSIVLLFYIIPGLIVYIIKIIKNKSKFTHEEKSCVYFQVVSFIISIVLQYLISNISILPFIMVLQLYYLYYTIENPDILSLNDAKKQKEISEKKEETKEYFILSLIKNMSIPISEIKEFRNKNKQKEYSKDEMVNIINELSNPANNLLNIFDNKLNLSSAVLEESSTQNVNYNFKFFIDSVINKTHKEIREKKIRLLLNIDSNVPSVLNGNSSKLDIVLTNIINNAVTFTEVGRIIINVSCVISQDNCELTFKITDTGCGMDNDTKSKLLNGSSMNGLYLSKKLIEAIGGVLWFDSEVAVGSNFYVKLNQKIVDPTPIGNYSEDETTSKNIINYKDYSNKKVLIVDDDILSVKLLKFHLEHYNFNVDVVNDGKECVKNIKNENQYDLIFMDDMMYQVSGVKALGMLKKLNKLYAIPPVVAYTANATIGAKEKFISYGFNNYLSKPINPFELNKIIEDILK